MAWASRLGLARGLTPRQPQSRLPHAHRLITRRAPALARVAGGLPAVVGPLDQLDVGDGIDGLDLVAAGAEPFDHGLAVNRAGAVEESVLKTETVGRPLMVNARRPDSPFGWHPPEERVDERLHRAADDERATRSACYGGDAVLLVEHDSGRHARERALAGLGQVALRLTQSECIGLSSPCGEVVHLVVEDEAVSRNGN